MSATAKLNESPGERVRRERLNKIDPILNKSATPSTQTKKTKHRQPQLNEDGAYKLTETHKIGSDLQTIRLALSFLMESSTKVPEAIKEELEKDSKKFVEWKNGWDKLHPQDEEEIALNKAKINAEKAVTIFQDKKKAKAAAVVAEELRAASNGNPPAVQVTGDGSEARGDSELAASVVVENVAVGAPAVLGCGGDSDESDEE
jgi:hypothetical protein